jgi:C4-dicarboxylate transporter DctM subunit
MNPTLLLFMLFFVCVLLHIPIGFSLGIASLATVVITEAVPLNFVVQTYFTATNSFPLLAVPFFILSGDLMMQGGISTRLVNSGKTLFGHLNGALAVITVFCCAIFAALSGSGPATVAAIGGIMIPSMIDDGYDPAFAGSISAASGTLGPVIPPSIVFSLYGVACGVSISDLFMAGIIPGLMMAGVLMAYAYFTCKKHNFGKPIQKATAKKRLAALNDAKFALFAPMIILGGIYLGICTPTEAAVVACFYAIIVGLLVYKEFTIKDLPHIIARSGLTAGTVLILLGGASAFGRVLALQKVPESLYNLITGVTDSRIVVFLLINLLLLIAGCFIEASAAVCILAPLLLSIAVQYGMTPLQFGCVFTVNMVIGQVTPPVGQNLFVAVSKAHVGIEKMMKWTFPMIILLIVVLLVVTFFEPVTLLIPELLR